MQALLPHGCVMDVSGGVAVCGREWRVRAGCVCIPGGQCGQWRLLPHLLLSVCMLGTQTGQTHILAVTGVGRWWCV